MDPRLALNLMRRRRPGPLRLAGYAPRVTPAGPAAVAALLLRRRVARPAPTPEGLIREAVARALASSPALAGFAFSPLAPRQKTAAPSVTYELAGNARERTLDGPLGKSRATFKFTARSKAFLDTQSAAEAVRNLLDGFNSIRDGRLGGLAWVDWSHQLGDADSRVTAADGTDAGTFETSCVYVIRYREPKPDR